MKATGVVRRIDDLGRVVIPKEIRRSMRLKEGDPLEIFTNNDGSVTFKKYQPYDSEDWLKAKNIAAVVLTEPFALYNSDGELEAATKSGFPNDIENLADTETQCHKIANGIDSCGYIVTTDCNYQNAVAVLAAFLKGD